MKNFPKPQNSMGGVNQFWFIPVNDIASFGDIILGELQGLELKSGKSWLSVYGVFSSKQFAENKKETKGGIIFERSFSLFYPGLSVDVLSQLEEMKGTRFVIAYKDNNGLYKVAGTADNPLNFTYNIGTGKNGADNQGINMQFYADSLTRVFSAAGGEKIKVIVIYNDWFLPSKDELSIMRTNLYLEGVGNLGGGYHWTSSEVNANQAYYMFSMSTGGFGTSGQKSDDRMRIRACRTFTAEEGAYSLRDVGPAGGLIFYIDGTTYYEHSPDYLSYGYFWSNITSSLVGTGTAIGTGKQNTLDIINQAGHTDSAAKLCNDLEIEVL
jgi:hypothetical protein